jgi:uncharacterized protein YjbI with pentapeptide repeats
MKFEIKNWITGKVMFTLEGADWKLAFVAAVKAGQEFKEADLSGKDFSGIELAGGVFDNSRFDNSRFDNSRFDNSSFYNSRFDNSSFDNSSFDGQIISKTPRPFLFIGPLGADQHQLMAVSTVKGIRLKTGCFSGSVTEFVAALKKKHGDNDIAKEYQAALALIELHFKLWK